MNSGDKFKADILAMITDGTSNDVRILLKDEEEITANIDVLCAQSDYFSTMRMTSTIWEFSGLIGNI